DPETMGRLPEGKIGEVWVRGGSITRGYWEAPGPSGQTFRQSPRDADEPHFLRTGDLGFVWNKELFVAGRLKDLIISRGRNLYPQDLELTVKDCHPAFRTVNGAAFSVERDDGEAIVVVHEIERTARNGTDLSALEKTVRDAVWREHDIALTDVVFIPPASLPKTTSGKVQRRLTKTLYLSGDLTAWTPRGQAAKGEAPAGEDRVAAKHTQPSAAELEARILERARALAGAAVGAVGAADSFGAIGIDSVLAAQLAKALNEELGLALEPTIFWEFSTPQLLARRLAAATSGETSSVPRNEEQSSAGHDLLKALRAALGAATAQNQR
ncbi:MAG: AMP-binding protein, partial [Hyphomicrobiales bacterium]|nr:AMP-binding protein [Hyphomicrobiales bacterium]